MESRRPVAHPSPVDEINLAEYAAVTWRYRWPILAVVLAVGLIAYVINRQLTPVYEVSVRLLATESQIIDDPTTRALSVARFRELLESPSLVAAVLQEFKLSSPPHTLTARRFLDSHLTVTEIPDTGILQASIRMTDTDLLVKLANKYAEKAVDLATRLNVEETVYARDAIGKQAEAAKQRLTQAEKALEEFRRRTQIELLRKDVESLLEPRPDIFALQLDIEAERAQLRQAEIELARQERVRNVPSSLSALPDPPRPAPRPQPNVPTERDQTSPKSPVATPETTPVWSPENTLRRPDGDKQAGAADRKEARAERQEIEKPTPAGRSHEPVPPNVPLPIRSELKDPYVNPVYEVLARDVAQSRTRLAGLERRREQLVGGLKLAAPTHAKLDALYRAETQLAHLSGEYDVARAAYLNAASKYEEASLQVTVRSPRLQILDAALPPERPVAPRILRNVAAAVLLALTMSIIAVLLIDSSRQRRI